MRRKNLNLHNICHINKKRIFFIICLLAGAILFFTFSWRNFFLENSKWVPKSGGIFTESLVGKISNISPLASDVSLFDLDLRQLLYRGLLQYNPTIGEIEDGLATLRISENGKTYFLTLKNSAKFSNGDNVTINDVLFTYEEVIQNPVFSNDPLKNAFEYVTLDVIDKQTVAFNLPEPNIYFSSLLTTPILRKVGYKNAMIEEINDPEFPANKHPIGTGPYVLKNIIHDNNGLMRVFLEKNKHFFAGEAFIDQLVFYVYSDFDYLKYNNHWTTMYSHLSNKDLKEFEPKLYEEYQKREYVLPRFIGIFFNLDNKTTANPYIRNALKLGVNKDLILGKEKGWRRIDSVFFFKGIEDWHEKNYRAAQKTLRENGFKYDKNKEIRVDEDGNPIKLRMITSTSPAIYSRFAQNIARIWEKELEIYIELDVLKPAEFQKSLKKRDYDLVFFGQNFSESPDSLSSWHSSQSGKLNLANLTNSDVDFLIEEVRFTGAQSDLLTLNQKLDEITPVIPLATPTYSLLVDYDLLGFSKTFGKVRKHTERFFGIEKWYFKQQRDWDWQKHKSKIKEYFLWLFS